MFMHNLHAPPAYSNISKGKVANHHEYGCIYILLFCDNEGCIFYAVDLMKPEATVILRNAKIDMFKGSMRLAVDKWGRIEVTEPANFIVKEDNNLSLVEYELVNVVEE
jgi:replication factor A1